MRTIKNFAAEKSAPFSSPKNKRKYRFSLGTDAVRAANGLGENLNLNSPRTWFDGPRYVAKTRRSSSGQLPASDEVVGEMLATQHRRIEESLVGKEVAKSLPG
jgi:hypothetical protein